MIEDEEISESVFIGVGNGDYTSDLNATVCDEIVSDKIMSEIKEEGLNYYIERDIDITNNLKDYLGKKEREEDNNMITKGIFDVYLFIWDELEKKWDGEVAKNKESVKFNTVYPYLMDKDISIEDEKVTIYVDNRKTVSLPVEEE